ncbi:MAG: magnesium transporter CorA family protein, partial [Actinomycetota bacterium]|nr:magnesium transporter CorA family protein [Actinomycetota bacterium]
LGCGLSVSSVTMIRTYRDGQLSHAGQAADDDIEAALALVGRPGVVVWLDVTPEQLPPVAERLGFHHHAVEDALKAADIGDEVAQRTKLDRFPGHVFLYLYRSSVDREGALLLRELPVFVNPGVLVTVDRANAIDVAELCQRWDAHPELARHGVAALLYGVLDMVVDSHLASVDALGDHVDRMEDDLFDGAGDADPTAMTRRGFYTRKSLVRMRRISAPMRELVTGVMRVEDDDQTPIPPALMPYYQDVYDHVLRVNDSIEGLRDLITTIYETRLTKADHALNTVMRKLAGWAAIIAVPTAVTGFYGQNLPYPGFLKPWGFWFSTALWVLVSGALYVGFRRRRWI